MQSESDCIEMIFIQTLGCNDLVFLFYALPPVCVGVNVFNMADEYIPSFGNSYISSRLIPALLFPLTSRHDTSY